MQRKLLFFVNPKAGHSEIRGSLMQVIQIVGMKISRKTDKRVRN